MLVNRHLCVIVVLLCLFMCLCLPSVPVSSPTPPAPSPPLLQPLTQFPWYHGAIPRDEAVRRLEQMGCRDG